jgi:hypothetical protein
MNDRQLFLLSPYRLPTHHQILLNEEEMSAWLNGFIVLWHPALLMGSKEPPRIDTPYDHEFPTENQVFVIPQSPPLFQPDDWPDRVRDAGAIHFQATPERFGTLLHIQQAIEQSLAPGRSEITAKYFGTPETSQLLSLPEEQIRPFLGLGFGYLMVESLFDAMDHEHLLDVPTFWNDIQSAIQVLLRPDGSEDLQKHLRDAASRLLAAREVLYSIHIHLLDICLLEKETLSIPFPKSMEKGFPLNLLANGSTLEKLVVEHPDRVQLLKEKLHPELVPPLLEICGGIYQDREDALLPMESQLWNLRKGKQVSRETLGAEVEVHARKRSAFHPQTPLWLYATGYRNALLFNFDNSVIPNYRSTLVNWPSPDGKAIDAFTRMPLNSHQSQTYFNLVYNLHQSISQDSAPTLALLHRGEIGLPFYEDWLALSQLGPVLGQWTTFSRYFSDAMAGEYTGPASADEFFSDYLEERINAHRPDPISAFANQSRIRRKIDNVWTVAAMYRALHTNPPTEQEKDSLSQLQKLEDRIESEGLDPIAITEGGPEDSDSKQLDRFEAEWGKRLADRLQVKAPENQPGYLLINTCSFPRRVALELSDFPGPIPIEGPIKAAQFDTDTAKLVVEIPALGFAWIPKTGPKGTPQPKNRLKLAEGLIVRNEYLEVELDPVTGGMKGIRDTRTQVSRLGQQLIYNPGSRMEAQKIQVTQNGSAVGEIISEGMLFNEQNEELATFKQRFRTWLTRPVVELRIEIHPTHLPTGYPWHAYYGSRFAWRDERTAIFRGINGTGTLTNHTRPQSPDYIELRMGRSNTTIFPGGLPFHQRQGSRMLDVLLIPEGEQGRVFDLTIALDRENLMQTAMGIVTSTPTIETSKGAPHIGPSGWLFHIDAPNLLLTSLRPYSVAGGPSRAILAQLLETTSFAGNASIRCVRNPVRGALLESSGMAMVELNTQDDSVSLDFSGGDLVRVQIDFD